MSASDEASPAGFLAHCDLVIFTYSKTFVTDDKYRVW